MMTQPSKTISKNLLINAMTGADQALLSDSFVAVTLRWNQVLVFANQPIEYIYFLEAGVASIVSTLPETGSTEVGIFGRDGLSGSAVLLGSDRSPHDTFIQVDGGPALRIGVEHLLDAVSQSDSLRDLLLRYVQTVLIQSAHSAVSNAHHRIEARLARWLLMCHDRVDGDNIHLTHKFMAMMVAAQRTGVTLALHVLEGAGAIRSKRGLVQILDREKLEDLAGDAYGAPEAEYERLISPLKHVARRFSVAS